MRSKLPGLLLAGTAILYLFEARGFETGFIADPIGPKAFPHGVGLVALVVGLVLLFTHRAHPGLDFPAMLRASLLALSLVAYALVLETLGFVVATTLEMTLLVGLFRGKLLHGLAGSLAVSLAFFFLFAYALSVPLPLGRLFGGS